MATTASTTPTASFDTFLMHFTTVSGTKPVMADFESAEKVVDITEYPDLGGEPNQIEVTTLTDHIQKNINGVQKLDAMQFGCNYIPADEKKLIELSKKGAEEWWAVVFGADASGNPDGHDGITYWQGELSYYKNGAGTDEARKMTITISVASEPSLLA